VWLREGDRLAAVAGWPANPEVATLPLEPGAALPAIPDTDHAVPVLHGDRLLGALTLSTARGRELVPAERTLLTDLASSAGLVLHKAALDRDLHAQLEELAASRRRVVAAEDTARRQLERNLHDGAQQQLVALRVQLGLARTVAGREGAEALAARLDSLSATAEEAVDAVRGVAHGIYPPLLAAEGLPAALSTAARRATVPVSLDVQDDLGRHPEPVEAALYFAAVAVLDAAGQAGASWATLTARATGGQLTLSVTTDVPPPPALLAAQRDRLDAVGGQLVADSPAAGSRLIASAPISGGEGEPATGAARAEALAL
jgi:signal transduction histidine kinase